MELSSKLKEQLKKAVRVSMRIEGYSEKSSPELQKQAKTLMELYGVKVSIPAK
ncbi:hypothetical protein [Thiomicrorhabdus aquaedulcis]|uniref:hypothetical protein n=1 Tax=Thiomicrorhabdus aquaedulcis TaxID=2211106 RepID=UPI001561FAB2|nr:hypothetical protein [Thiomicrorhabdus aquaedulcis]